MDRSRPGIVVARYFKGTIRKLMTLTGPKISSWRQGLC